MLAALSKLKRSVSVLYVTLCLAFPPIFTVTRSTCDLVELLVLSGELQSSESTIRDLSTLPCAVFVNELRDDDDGVDFLGPAILTVD